MNMNRIKSFLLELLVFFPGSIIINILALVPFALFLGFTEKGGATGEMDYITLVGGTVLSWGLGFFVNKLRMNIRGRRTVRFEDLEIEESLWAVDKYTGKRKEIYSRKYDATVKHHTWYDTVAILLSFVAAPLGFIALIMSFFSLFFKRVYSTPFSIDRDSFSFGNNALHTLFDFVILPAGKRKGNGGFNLLGLLGVITYPIIIFGGYLLSVWLANTLIDKLPEAFFRLIGLIPLPPTLVMIILVFLIAIIVLVDTLALTFDYSGERLKKFFIHFLILFAVFALSTFRMNLVHVGLGMMEGYTIKELIEWFILLVNQNINTFIDTVKNLIGNLSLGT